MEAIKEAQANLENHNKSLQETLKKERGGRRETRLSRVIPTQEIVTSPGQPTSPLPTSASAPSLSILPPRPQANALPQISPKLLSKPQPPTSPQSPQSLSVQTEKKESKEESTSTTTPTQDAVTPIQPIQVPKTPEKETKETKETKEPNTEKNTESNTEKNTETEESAPKRLSLEELLQQADPEADAETLQMLANDLGSLQLELNGAKSEIVAMNKKLESKEDR